MIIRIGTYLATVVAPVPVFIANVGCGAGPTGIARVGQRVESGGIALTVNSVERRQTLEPFGRAEAGKTFIVADVTIENVNRDQAPHNPLYFRVGEANGYEHACELNIEENALKSREPAKGKTVKGTIASKVPADARGVSRCPRPYRLKSQSPYQGTATVRKRIGSPAYHWLAHRRHRRNPPSSLTAETASS